MAILKHIRIKNSHYDATLDYLTICHQIVYLAGIPLTVSMHRTDCIPAKDADARTCQFQLMTDAR